MPAKRLACFVEGVTEHEFFVRLISAIAGNIGLQIECTELWGKGQSAIVESTFSTGGIEPKFCVLIVNCNNDGRVVTAIRDRYEGLVKEGYDLVLGIRDVYPVTHSKLNSLRAGIDAELPNGSVICKVLLSVMEIEAWFLADHVHLTRIDARLTQAYILQNLGIDISPQNVESFYCPTDELQRIYRLVGKVYYKGRRRAMQTLDRLSYDDLYLQHSRDVNSLGALCNTLDQFF